MAHQSIEAPGFPPDFHRLLGIFHCMWLMFDANIDYTIGSLLQIPAEETHILVSGMEFGRKLRLTIELLKRSDHKQKNVLIENLRILQGAKRDIITHSYIASSPSEISFIYRSRGEYKAGALNYSIKEFEKHVMEMVSATQKYQRALDASDEEVLLFAQAVLNVKP